MQQSPGWLALFREAGLLPAAEPKPFSTYPLRRQPVFMIDGTHWIEQHIGPALNVNYLVRDLRCVVENQTKILQATSAYVFFDSHMTAPFLTPGRILAQDPALVKAFDTAFMASDDFQELSTCLRGDQANIKWPEHLTTPAMRQAFWHVPLFEWQIYSEFDVHLTTLLIDKKLHQFPVDKLEAVIITGVPSPDPHPNPNGKTSWSNRVFEVERQHEELLRDSSRNRAIRRLKGILTVLDMGYRRSSTHELMPMTKKHKYMPVNHLMDVYMQATRHIYQGKKKFAHLSYRFYKAREETLWTFLLLVHRVRRAKLDALDLVVQFSSNATDRDSEHWVDVVALYDQLYAFLVRDDMDYRKGPPLDMETFFFFMIFQTHRGIDTPASECRPDLLWQTFLQFTGRAGRSHALYRAPSLKPLPVLIQPIEFIALYDLKPPERENNNNNAVSENSMYLDDIGSLPRPFGSRLPGLSWCETLVSHEQSALIGLYISQSVVWRALEEHGCTNMKMPWDTASLLLPAEIVQVAYRQWSPYFSNYRVSRPSQPQDVHARSRRAHWLFECQRRAHSNKNMENAQRHLFDMINDRSYWGWTKRSMLFANDVSLHQPHVARDLLLSDALRIITDPAKPKCCLLNLYLLTPTIHVYVAD